MADTNKIRLILQKSVRPNKYVTQQQLTEIVGKVAELRSIDESTLKAISLSVTRDSELFIVAATDMGDIKDELTKPKK